MDAIVDLNDQPVRQVDKLEVGNLLQVNSSSADATTLNKARVVTAEQTVQMSKQEKAVQASVESPVRQWPSGEKRTQASDTGLEKAAVRVEAKSMGSEQKMAVAVDADSGRFSKNDAAKLSGADVDTAARSQEMTSNRRQVHSERLDKKVVVHQELTNPRLQNHLMEKAQSKHVLDPGDQVQKKQTPLVLKSPVEKTRASNSSTITTKQNSMGGQRSLERAFRVYNSNLMPDSGDALSALV